MGPPLGNDFVAFEVYKWLELKIHAGLSRGFLDILFSSIKKKVSESKKETTSVLQSTRQESIKHINTLCKTSLWNICIIVNQQKCAWKCVALKDIVIDGTYLKS